MYTFFNDELDRRINEKEGFNTYHSYSSFCLFTFFFLFFFFFWILLELGIKEICTCKLGDHST